MNSNLIYKLLDYLYGINGPYSEHRMGKARGYGGTVSTQSVLSLRGSMPIIPNPVMLSMDLVV
ncbi:MAG: hypothetical protein IPP29_05815 [Bacteroidetes bacterium]|nr:hypothetical protein [Bacteroidota bacterium]